MSISVNDKAFARNDFSGRKYVGQKTVDSEILVVNVAGFQFSGAAICRQFENSVVNFHQIVTKPKPQNEIFFKAHTLDVAVDKAQFAHQLELCKKSGKVAKEYFEKRINYLNISSFERARRLGLDFAFFADCFIGGGTIPLSAFEGLWELHGEDFLKPFKETEYFEDVKALDEGGKLVVFEAKTDDALLKVWKREKDDLYSIAPIVAFYMSRKTEIKIAKLIVAGVKNHVAPQIIKERMRELYA